MAHHPNSHHAAPSPIAMGQTVKKVHILAMGASRTDFDAIQMVEQRPDILVDAEIWAINYMAAIKRVDRVIHVDPVHPYLGHGPVKDMCDYTLKDGIPFYTSWPHPMYSNHVVYPFDKVYQAIGVTYFNSSVAYALALAMAEGYTDIGMWGADFSYPNAHQSESGRGCVEFLMGMGTQRGIRFCLAQTTTLLDMYCRQQPYGFFKNPLQPPGNGGALMTVPEIMDHCQKMRQPRNFAAPAIYAYGIAPNMPAAPQRYDAMVPEHEVVPVVSPMFQVPAAAQSGGALGQEQAVETPAVVTMAEVPHVPLGRKPKPNGAAHAVGDVHISD